ncbi:MAG: DNA methyltransferase [Gammaproteobacteria bacterium]|nr:DNA methyltransferase [Gammaproteobacteria bacterium]
MARKPVPKNKLYVGDNLDVMHGMNSCTVDLIYLDPPFNSKRMYRAPIGSSADKKAAKKGRQVGFHDIWVWEKDVDIRLLSFYESHPDLFTYIDLVGKMNGASMKTYLTFMAQRLIEMHRILKDTGSVYLHCDPYASHYLKLLMDEIFGKHNFLNEMIWYYTNASRGKKKLANSHDVIFWYCKNNAQYTFNRDRILQEFASGMTEWRYSKGGQAGQKMPKGKTPDDVFILPSLNAMSKERTGYPTQKPLALLDRIIQASSVEGDMVMDPFCGCATTCVSAQNHHRNWIGIDLEDVAIDLVVDRLSETDNGQTTIQFNDFIASKTPPVRTDLETLTWTKKRIHAHCFDKQSGRCNGCKKPFEAYHLEIDHIYPKSLGGAWLLENLQLLCGNCNRIKGDRPMEYLRARLAERRERQKAVF